MATTRITTSVQSRPVAVNRSKSSTPANSARINIRDVAKRANVSIGTVSLAVNNRPGISEKTRKQVLSIVEEMGYVPSLIGRAINRCTAGVIGVLMPVAHSPLFAPMVAGINDEAEDDRQMPIFVSFSQDRSVVEARMLRIFSQMRIDGLIFAAAPDSQNISLTSQLFCEHNVPVVQIERQAVGLKADFVGSENRHAAFEQTLGLLRAGYESVGCVMPGQYLSTVEERFMGWQDALREQGVEIKPGWVKYLDGKEHPSSAAAFTAMVQDDDFPRAMLWCAGDTAVVPRVLNELKMVNGRDVDVVLFDADPTADFAGQQFTHIEQDGYQIGRAAAKLLLQRCDVVASQEGDSPSDSRRQLRFPCDVFSPAHDS